MPSFALADVLLVYRHSDSEKESISTADYLEAEGYRVRRSYQPNVSNILHAKLSALSLLLMIVGAKCNHN